MNSNRVLLCMGTRPEIIKMAPVYHALRSTEIKPIVLHTGQHEEMAWPLYEFFGMEPTLRVRLDRQRTSLGHLSGLIINEVDEVFATSSADAVLVHGDTTSALMAALAAFYRKLPIGHVEAGLRSFDATNPFPEEMNRQMISRLARWHFVPTVRARENLIGEGIDETWLHLVGNTIVDATRWGTRNARLHPSVHDTYEKERVHQITDRARSGKLVLVTAHRRENWGTPLMQIADTVRRLAGDYDDLHVVWPVHINPVVRNIVDNAMQGLPADVAQRISILDPVNYPQMLWLLRHAWLVMTDSGGIQEEAAALHIPVLVLREKTERPEIIDAGGGALIGTDPDAIRAWVTNLLSRPDTYAAMRTIENPYGDGYAARYIAKILRRELVLGTHKTEQPAQQFAA